MALRLKKYLRRANGANRERRGIYLLVSKTRTIRKKIILYHAFLYKSKRIVCSRSLLAPLALRDRIAVFLLVPLAHKFPLFLLVLLAYLYGIQHIYYEIRRCSISGF